MDAPPALLIVAHAPLASTLKALAAHTFPECAAQLLAFDVGPDDDPERVAAAIRAAIGERDALVLTDVFGATPCNIARGLENDREGRHVRVVAGVNVPMIWRTLCYRDATLAELAAKAAEGGTRGVIAVPPETPPQNQPQPPSSHAQVDDHHQQ